MAGRLQRPSANGARAVPFLTEVMVQGCIVFVGGSRAQASVSPFLPLGSAEVRDQRIRQNGLVIVHRGPCFSTGSCHHGRPPLLEETMCSLNRVAKVGHANDRTCSPVLPTHDGGVHGHPTVRAEHGTHAGVESRLVLKGLNGQTDGR